MLPQPINLGPSRGWKEGIGDGLEDLAGREGTPKLGCLKHFWPSWGSRFVVLSFGRVWKCGPCVDVAEK